VAERCEHRNFYVRGNVTRLTDGDDGPVTGYSVDFTVWCDVCKEPFVFIGLPAGMSFKEPMVSVDGREARMPIAPASLFGPLAGIPELGGEEKRRG
jgi:hypothetical protein